MSFVKSPLKASYPYIEIISELHNTKGKNPKKDPNQKNLLWIIFEFFKKGIKAIKGIKAKYVLKKNARPIHNPENK